MNNVDLIKTLTKFKKAIEGDINNNSKIHTEVEDELRERDNEHDVALIDSSDIVAELYEAVEELGNVVGELADALMEE